MRRIGILATAVALGAAVAALAQETPTPLNPQIEPPPGDIGRYYPTRALEERQNGLAALCCHAGVAPDGVACVIESETPQHSEFGTALMHLARGLHVSTASYQALSASPEKSFRLRGTFMANMDYSHNLPWVTGQIDLDASENCGS